MERKDAIEIIKKNWPDSNFTVLREALETLIPELNESEDIRIIKAIKYGLDRVFINNTTVFEVTKEQCLAWLKKKDEQKSAWSEEDEKNLRETEYAIMKFFGGDCSLVGWLRKNLKERVLPQNTWKPSDEQIKAVKEAACYSSVFSEKTIDNLISLSKQLKKLREE